MMVGIKKLGKKICNFRYSILQTAYENHLKILINVDGALEKLDHNNIRRLSIKQLVKLNNTVYAYVNAILKAQGQCLPLPGKWLHCLKCGAFMSDDHNVYKLLCVNDKKLKPGEYITIEVDKNA